MGSGGKDNADKPKKKPGRRFVTFSQISWSCQLTSTHYWSFQSNCLCWMQATQISVWSKCKPFTASDSAQNVGAVLSLLVITFSYYVFIAGPLREMYISRLRLDLPRWSVERSSSRMQLLNIIYRCFDSRKGQPFDTCQYRRTSSSNWSVALSKSRARKCPSGDARECVRSAPSSIEKGYLENPNITSRFFVSGPQYLVVQQITNRIKEQPDNRPTSTHGVHSRGRPSYYWRIWSAVFLKFTVRLYLRCL